MKSGCVELLGTCILSIDPGGDVPNAKSGATKPVIKSPLNYGGFSKSYSLLSRKYHAYTQFCDVLELLLKDTLSMPGCFIRSPSFSSHWPWDLHT